ncbi:hypothetical protein ACOACO_17650 [Nocardioides sp. CPCC 205120]|uniref:hypothetical protein n=1 Tax=Nocardioides sp. CPCC 205120 TaxID=3406462 RepID=UPI003B506563
MTTTTAPAPVATTDAARRLLAAALVEFADRHEAALASQMTDEARLLVQADVALARSMAAHTTGWTHTTRLREFLESATAREEVDAHVDALPAGPTSRITTPFSLYLEVISAVATDGEGHYWESAEAEFRSNVDLELLHPEQGARAPIAELDLLRAAVRVAQAQGHTVPERALAAVSA